jgi:hypothetical protein
MTPMTLTPSGLSVKMAAMIDENGGLLGIGQIAQISKIPT